MNLRERSGRRREHPDMEMTPLIDVVFLLLIFFLITTTFSNKEAETEIPLDLPEAASGETASDTERLTVTVGAGGGITISGVEVQGETMLERLQNAHDERPDAPVLLKGDREASHGRIIEILDVIKRAGFSRVNIVAREPSGAGTEAGK